MSNRLEKLELFHLSLPFRGKFSHATAERNCTDTVVAAAHLADGTVGFGEGLPRKYVTGETVESVLYNIENTFAPLLTDLEPQSFTHLIDFADQLPLFNSQGQVINVARCAVELALLDAYSKHFNSSLNCLTGWLGHPAFAGKPSIETIRVTGVLDGSTPEKIAKRLKIMRLFGLRDFKIKLGCDHDHDNLTIVHRKLAKAIEKNKATLRADANEAWDIDDALNMAKALPHYGVCCLEQPLAANDLDHLRTLADLTSLPIMADESLVTLEQAEQLAKNDLVDFFNIRISKNGGLLPSLKMVTIADKYNCKYQLGAMVGESGILAAAGRKFLEIVPNTVFTEICYANLLLQKDIVKPNMTFGFGGKIKKLAPPGLGITVSRQKISSFLASPTRQIHLA